MEYLDAALNIPQHARGIARGSNNLLVIDESAAREIAGVRVQLAADTDRELLALKIVNRANVIETTTGNKVVGGGISAGHDPGRAQRDGVGLVRRERVPHEQLAVLRGRHKVDLIGRPVHGVDLGKVAFEGTTNTGLGAAVQ